VEFAVLFQTLWLEFRGPISRGGEGGKEEGKRGE